MSRELKKNISILIIAGIALAFFFYTVFSGSGVGTNTITKSTVERSRLQSSNITDIGYFEDGLGWIKNKDVLEDGMSEFYQKTGVMPYLVLVSKDKVSDCSTEGLNSLATQMYQEKISDQAHLLVLYVSDDENFYVAYSCGEEAKQVMDQEALEILDDYINSYYYNNSLSDEEYFSKAFSDAGQSIMTVNEASGSNLIEILLLVVVAVIAFYWWGKAKKKNEGDEDEKLSDSDDNPCE